VYHNGTYFLIGEATYTTGTQSEGDAYRCQVNDDESYIFNIIGQDDHGNYNMLLNYNLGISSDGLPDEVASTLFSLTDNWNNLDVRTDSISGKSINDDGTEFTYTFNYSNHYARLIEYSELERFAEGTDFEWDENSKPWISSIPKDRQKVNEIDWKYIASTFTGINEDGHVYTGLGCGVAVCSDHMTGIRPVITVASSDIE